MSFNPISSLASRVAEIASTGGFPGSPLRLNARPRPLRYQYPSRIRALPVALPKPLRLFSTPRPSMVPARLALPKPDQIRKTLLSGPVANRKVPSGNFPRLSPRQKASFFAGTGLTTRVAADDFDAVSSLMLTVDRARALKVGYDFADKTLFEYRTDWVIPSREIVLLLAYLAYEVGGGRLDGAWYEGALSMLADADLPNAEAHPLDYLPEPSVGLMPHLDHFLDLADVRDMIEANVKASDESALDSGKLPTSRRPGRGTDLAAYDKYSGAESKSVSMWSPTYFEEVQRELHRWYSGSDYRVRNDDCIGGGRLDPRETDIGRFYLSLLGHSQPRRVGMLAAHLIAMQQILEETDVLIQYKLVVKPEEYARNDAGVIYFRAKDQQSVYRHILTLHRDFEGLFKPGVPLFAAQILDGQGLPLSGLSFGQEPSYDDGHRSFGELRTDAITAANRALRARLALGERVTLAHYRRLMRHHLYVAGVNADYPAFNAENWDQFEFLSRHSDQDWTGTGSR